MQKQLDLATTEVGKIYTLLNTNLNEISINPLTISNYEQSQNVINKTNTVISDCKTAKDMLETWVKKINQLLQICKDFATTMNKNTQIEAEDNFVYQTFAGMLAYRTEEKEVIIQKNETESSVRVNALGCDTRLPAIMTMKTIPRNLNPFFYCSETQEFWMCMPRNVYIKVPFPVIIDSTIDPTRACSIRCRNGSKRECEIRSKHDCKYAHTGDRMIKLGILSRCPSVPNFGNPATFANDIAKVDTHDIKNLMLHAVSDIFIINIWLQIHGISDRYIRNLEFG